MPREGVHRRAGGHALTTSPDLDNTLPSPPGSDFLVHVIGPRQPLNLCCSPSTPVPPLGRDMRSGRPAGWLAFCLLQQCRASSVPQTSMIAESRLKELTPLMPVIFIRAIPVDRQDLRNIYDCPVYKTKMRGPTFVWTFNLKTKEKPSKWTLGGVAILLQV